MYSISEKKTKGKIIDTISINGFPMGSKDKVFKISNSKVRKIKITNKKLANPLVSKKVMKQYNKLIEYLTESLLDEDDDGETCREALNQIEKFRLIIKNKYREFLKKKEIETMSKQLVLLKKELLKKEIQIRDSYLEYIDSNKRSK
ncbi:MAG: hypothetical protein IJG97_04565 [Bacilli bacterium]|nr:hypothetical protein [Bacilli bacterium]